MSQEPKPFAVRFRDHSSSRLKLSVLRFLVAEQAREYALHLIDHGAKSVSIVKLDGRRRYTACWSLAGRKHRPVDGRKGGAS